MGNCRPQKNVAGQQRRAKLARNFKVLLDLLPKQMFVGVRTTYNDIVEAAIHVLRERTGKLAVNVGTQEPSPGGINMGESSTSRQIDRAARNDSVTLDVFLQEIADSVKTVWRTIKYLSRWMNIFSLHVAYQIRYTLEKLTQIQLHIMPMKMC